MLNEHLKWTDITDFTKGLWSASSSFLMPPDAFQTMQDCYPQAGGGLRAFFKPTQFPTTGLPSDGSYLPQAIINVVYPYTLGFATGYLLIMVKSDLSYLRAYWYHGQDVSATWVLKKTWGPRPVGSFLGSWSWMSTYKPTDAFPRVAVTIVGLGSSATDGDGMWLYRPDNDTWYASQRSGANLSVSGPVIEYQDRLVASYIETINYTDPGGIDFPAANFITVSAGSQQVKAPASLVPFAPSALLVPLTNDYWFGIEGDITDPIIRQMGTTHHPAREHHCVETDHGVIFHEEGKGFYGAQSMGSVYEHLDFQLEPYPAPATALSARHGFADGFGFVFAPGGRVYDSETRAWFTINELTSISPRAEVFHYDSTAQGIFAMKQVSGFDLPRFPVSDQSSARYSSYTVKTAPFHEADGRQVVIREVQVFVKSLNSAASVAVTVNGTTRTASSIGTGQKFLSFLFHERGQYLDVQVVSASNTSGEAPIMEAMRIGVRSDGHQLR